MLPTFVLGNIHVGGTGKTPHASYFLQLLSEMLGGPEKVALLSRGYKRKSSGFKWVEKESDWREFGDEPMLLKNLNPLNPIAVCADRLKGVRMIKNAKPDVQVVILDDGLQHRALKPHFALGIVDSHRPLKGETLLPGGALRDLKSRIDKFDAIVISRASKPLDEELKSQGLTTDHRVFISHMKDEPYELQGKPRMLAVSGIAEPQRFMKSLASKWSVVRREAHPDHYEFTEKEVKGWLASIRNEKLEGIVTTSKDAVRIRPLIDNHPEIKLHSICIGVKWSDEEYLKNVVNEWVQFTIFGPSKTNNE